VQLTGLGSFQRPYLSVFVFAFHLRTASTDLEPVY